LPRPPLPSVISFLLTPPIWRTNSDSSFPLLEMLILFSFHLIWKCLKSSSYFADRIFTGWSVITFIFAPSCYLWSCDLWEISRGSRVEWSVKKLRSLDELSILLRVWFDAGKERALDNRNVDILWACCLRVLWCSPEELKNPNCQHCVVTTLQVFCNTVEPQTTDMNLFLTVPLSCFASTNSWFVARSNQK
jgi:hypothetical protein